MEQLDADTCYRALQTRDTRFDGRFFTAVRTTGVYCRPICPARTPKRENCLFVACAAAAEEAGFRPCLRCRPEASPGTPAWQGTSATVSRGLRLIADGALDTGSVDDLAERLGVGARHLRRLFLEHLGAPPLSVANTRRLHFAKKLIDETRLPMSRIAFASGFSSIRRFNDAVRATFHRSPRELRRSQAGDGPADPSRACESPALLLRLPYREPLAWSPLASFFASRAIPGVECAGPDHYARTIEVDGVAGVVEVRPEHGASHLRASIQLSAPASLIRISERLRQVFDLTADPDRIAGWLRRDRSLRPRVARHPGLRVPGAWDPFELAVRAVLGQQVSVRGATTLAGRLVATYGRKLPAPLALPGAPRDAAPARLFPRPDALVRVDPGAIGLPRARAETISHLARAVCEGRVRLEPGRSLERFVEELCALPGIGEWTAHYVAMRAMREPDAFPASDLGLRRALGDERGPASTARVLARSESWRPWRAYAALHLWTSPAPPAAGATKGRRSK